jgi:hypothetical protein
VNDERGYVKFIEMFEKRFFRIKEDSNDSKDLDNFYKMLNFIRAEHMKKSLNTELTG